MSGVGGAIVLCLIYMGAGAIGVSVFGEGVLAGLFGFIVGTFGFYWMTNNAKG